MSDHDCGRALAGQALVSDQAAARFWAKVDRAGDCWKWTGALDSSGYGRFWFSGKLVAAHRFSLTLAGQTLASGLVVDHICRTRACVNPDHLRQVSNRTNLIENSIAAAAIGVAKALCKRGHPLSGDNLRFNKSGSRRCRACDAAWLRQSRSDKKGVAHA